jgi:hypothetical protein
VRREVRELQRRGRGLGDAREAKFEVNPGSCIAVRIVRAVRAGAARHQRYDAFISVHHYAIAEPLESWYRVILEYNQRWEGELSRSTHQSRGNGHISMTESLRSCISTRRPRSDGHVAGRGVLERVLVD